MKKWIYVAECLYRKCAGGKIYIRIQQSGKRVMRSTKTDKPVRAGTILKRMRDEAWAEKYNAVLPGPQVRERMLTVKLLIADYVQAGHPTKKMRTKDPDTIRREINLLKPMLEWWGGQEPERDNSRRLRRVSAVAQFRRLCLALHDPRTSAEARYRRRRPERGYGTGLPVQCLQSGSPTDQDQSEPR